MLLKFSASLLLFFCYLSIYGKGPVSSAYQLPLHSKVSFSGGFGELRKNHFHTGLDFRTNGQVGWPVYAVQKGSVKRVSVSPYGYGNALYLVHPDGTTSVYGHLSRFHPKIASYVLQQQYKLQQFMVDLPVPAGFLEVNQGEVIAWSGNSGSSGGPHLHFEIRNTASEKPQNPLHYLPGIVDKSSPKINSVYLYALNNQSYVGNRLRKIRLETLSAFHQTRLKTPQPIELFGDIGIGIQCEDDFNGEGMKCGIYSAELAVDQKEVFGFRMDHLDFDMGRSVNSHLDYEELVKNHRWIHHLFLQPGNLLDIYLDHPGRGIISLKDGKSHVVTITVSDAFGNRNSCQFKVSSKPAKPIPTVQNYIKMFLYDVANSYENNEVKINLPRGSLFDNLGFMYETTKFPGSFLSKIHRIHLPEVPVNLAYQLSIKINPLPERLQSKTLIVLVDKKGNQSAIGGVYSAGWVSAKSRLFGDFAVVLDTIPPIIRMVKIPGQKGAEKSSEIVCKIGDNLSGINDYEGLIDGQWVLFEYDAKSGILSHDLGKSQISLKGLHSLQITVVDQCQNRSVVKTKIKL